MSQERLLALASVVEQVARQAYQMYFAQGLFPTQWSALRYYASARPEDRTASAFAKFQQITRAPATKSTASLLRRGLLKVADEQIDSRAKVVEVTADGRKLLEEDPLRQVLANLGKLSAEEQAQLLNALVLLNKLHT